MPDALDTFLAGQAALPWSWGAVDCAMTVAEWAIANGHADPFAAYRGTYDSEEAYVALVVPRGGILPLVSDCLARCGLGRVEEPERGTIAVIGSAISPLRQWCAIHDGAWWKVRVADGFATMAARPLAMWSV
jgi:hypothetical protein